ncbi:hypothetical protein [Uliginosibacterium sp. H1]|uniref:hypothetical protein n=1 Tax=Uliginosibacterium sp. H1 TaxID=3114757 RepID=UPI002E184E94|nr:hypothetical protein [Uliginosibacterium sp. H1]
MILSPMTMAQQMKEITEAQAKTVSAGQTKDQVVKSLGKPINERKVKARPGNSALVYAAKPPAGQNNAYFVVELDSAGKVVNSGITAQDTD